MGKLSFRTLVSESCWLALNTFYSCNLNHIAFCAYVGELVKRSQSAFANITVSLYLTTSLATKRSEDLSRCNSLAEFWTEVIKRCKKG